MENKKYLELVKSNSTHRSKIKLTLKSKPIFIGEIDSSSDEGSLIIKKKA